MISKSKLTLGRRLEATLTTLKTFRRIERLNRLGTVLKRVFGADRFSELSDRDLLALEKISIALGHPQTFFSLPQKINPTIKLSLSPEASKILILLESRGGIMNASLLLSHQISVLALVCLMRDEILIVGGSVVRAA